MKKTLFVGIALLLGSTAAWAQPPEEVPPPPPETAVEPAPEPVAPAPAPIPVAEPQAAPAPAAAAAPEDKRVRGIDLAPYVGFYPIGYDSINITGTQGNRYFFEIQPGIDLSSSFKTATDKTLNWSAGYSLTYREYYNKTTSKRDFENDVTSGVGVQWTPRFGTNADLLFIYFVKGGPDNEADNGIVIELTPMLNFKVNPELSLRVGYYGSYLDSISEFLDAGSATDPPSSAEDLTNGISNYGASGFDTFGATSLDFFSPTTNAGETRYLMAHRAVAAASWSPIKGTKLGFEYRYEFAMLGNLSKDSLSGHFFIPSASQELPWGTSVGIKDEFRMRKYNNTKVADTTIARQAIRNRLTFTVNQPINKYMGFEAFYRLQFGAENKDDYKNLTWNNWFYTGVKFTF